jgi:hypothetical protein
MKRLIVFGLIAGLGFGAGGLVVARQLAVRQARERAAQQAVWEAERAELEAGLEKARARRFVARPASLPAGGAASATRPDPQELLSQLMAAQVSSGPGQGRALRHVLALLGQLAQAGPMALPAIRQYLASGQDAAYEAPGGKGLGRDPD